MILKNIEPFKGEHCETTATGCLLYQIGVRLSEPMLFGLGEGLNFIYWYMKGMDFPFMGGRIKPDQLTSNIAKNLNLNLKVSETSSVQKARQQVIQKLEQQIAIGLKLDAYHLEYFTQKIHFAAHYVTMYGFDDTYAYLIDTMQQGCFVKTSLKSLELARNEKGPMASRNRMFTLSQESGSYFLEDAILNALISNAREYLNPPINNISFRGILKAASEIKKWFKKSLNLERDFNTMSILMEKAGTGGAIFRNLYRDFLRESSAIISDPLLIESHAIFIEVAAKWNMVADLFSKVENKNDYAYIEQASELLIEIACKERKVMERLSTILYVR